MQAGKFIAASEISPICLDGMYACYGGNGIRGYPAGNPYRRCIGPALKTKAKGFYGLFRKIAKAVFFAFLLCNFKAQNQAFYMLRPEYYL